MLNQFHDVLPGTSIKMVNDDVHEINDRRIAQTTDLLEDAVAALLPRSHAMNGLVDSESDVVILDPLRARRTQVITLNRSLASCVPTAQHISEQRSVALVHTGPDGLGTIVSPESTIAPIAEHQGDAHVLRNSHLSLTISDGRITGLRDESIQRELILSGPGAQDAGLVIYDDLPLAYDAWDAEIYHLDRPTPLRFDDVEIVANGPLRATLQATAKFGSSRFTLLVSDQHD